MKLVDALRLSTVAVRTHRGRAIASVLPVFAGTFALVLTMAWGAGFREFMNGQVQSYGRPHLIARAAVTSSDFVGFRGGRVLNFSVDVASHLAAAEGHDIESVIIEHRIDPQPLIRSHKASKRYPLSAVGSGFLERRGFRIAYGRHWNDTEVASRVAILGHEAAVGLFGSPEEAVGGRLRISDRSVYVVGVAAKKGRQYFNPSRPDNEHVMIPLESALTMLHVDPEDVSHLLVFPRPSVSTEDLSKALRRGLGARLRFHADDEAALTVRDNTRLMAIVDLIYLGFVVFAGLAGVVTLLVAATGLANYHLSVLASRSVELAVARSFGATRSQLRFQTLAESLLLSGAASFTGTAAALLLCGAFMWVLSSSDLPKPALMSPALAAVPVALLATSVAAAIAPLRRCSRLDIALAVREGG